MVGEACHNLKDMSGGGGKGAGRRGPSWALPQDAAAPAAADDDEEGAGDRRGDDPARRAPPAARRGPEVGPLAEGGQGPEPAVLHRHLRALPVEVQQLLDVCNKDM